MQSGFFGGALGTNLATQIFKKAVFDFWATLIRDPLVIGPGPDLSSSSKNVL
jgi:hypothetical protein